MIEKAKVITVCGSLRFQNEIMKQTERLALEGNCVLSIIYPTKDVNYTDERVTLFGKLHNKELICLMQFL